MPPGSTFGDIVSLSCNVLTKLGEIKVGIISITGSKLRFDAADGLANPKVTKGYIDVKKRLAVNPALKVELNLQSLSFSIYFLFGVMIRFLNVLLFKN